MKLLRRIVQLGVSDELNYQVKREIVATNYLTLILTGAICLFIILRNFSIPNAPYEIYWPVGIGLFLLPLLLNALFLTTISRLILCYVPVFFIWFTFVSNILQVDTVQQSMFDTLRIFFLSLSFIPYLILERKRPVLLILGILPTLFSFLFFNYLLRLSGVPYDQDTLHTPDYQLMGIRSFTAYVILNAGCFAFQAIIADNDRYNQKLVSELKKKSVEIEQQYRILLQKQSELNEINQHLEELVNIKSRSIKRQNEMLIKYSYTNAHKVRGPLARILGLIQVSRLKTDLNFPWFFEKVEEETKGIDTIISSISNELSNVENESTGTAVMMRSNIGLFVVIFYLLSVSLFAQNTARPNVIIIITDDQGYGDLRVTGNPHVRTPAIDNFAAQSIRFNNFYVSPVCAPTRSSLMTGRYSLRTGVHDTYNGGATMASSEITTAEMLNQAGYKTGIFGKWHLGDNYPGRPNDQGFDESLIHLSGGMGQVGDITTYFNGDKSYFDPTLWHNGKQEAFKGYCSDIFAEQAIGFIEKNRDTPFFCYLAFNAPHTPLQVPEKYYQLYKDIDPSVGLEKSSSFLKMSEQDKEDARKVYAMVTNIDENVGRLLKKLDDLKLSKNTIVIFLTDNGPQQSRYVGGMRGKKGSVYQGGVRVPFYLRYPALGADKDIQSTAAHIDVLPTLSQLCRFELPQDRKIDGKSLLPLIKGEQVDWADRSLFFYWTRRYPERYNNIALLKGDYKLVGQNNYDAPVEDFELFNIKTDPNEQINIVVDKKEIANGLKTEFDSLFMELITSDNLINPPRIIVGNRKENPVILNRNDAGGERGIWDQEEVAGNWKVSLIEGQYNIKFKFIKPLEPNGHMVLETNTLVNQKKNEIGRTDIIEMKNIYLPAMDCELIPFYAVGSKNIFPFWVEMERIE